MAYFRFPIKLCEDIERLCSNFWWGNSDSGKQMHWVAWKKLCLPKTHGGLSFRNLTKFNQAMIAKQVWCILKHPNSLLARVLKGHYFRDGDVMTAKASNNCSFMWRSLYWGRELLRGGLRWRVANGKDIRAKDIWIPGVNEESGGCIDDTPNYCIVSHFIDFQGEWKVVKLREIFHPYVTGYLYAIDYYKPHATTISMSEGKWWKLVWALNIPPKVKYFLWLMLKNLIVAKSNPASHHVSCTDLCSWCRNAWGTTTHCLVLCGTLNRIWKDSEFWPMIKPYLHLSMWDISHVVRDNMGNDGLEKWFTWLWVVWHFLCEIKHGESINSAARNFNGNELMLTNFQEARAQLSFAQRLLPPEGESSWQTPQQGVFRVDVDVSIREDSPKIGVRLLSEII